MNVVLGTIFVNFSLIIETCRSSVQNFVQVYLIETTDVVIRNKLSTNYKKTQQTNPLIVILTNLFLKFVKSNIGIFTVH